MISLTIGLLLYFAAASVAIIGVTADQLYRAHSRKILRMKREADRRHREHMELSRTLPEPKPNNTTAYTYVEPTQLF